MEITLLWKIDRPDILFSFVQEFAIVKTVRGVIKSANLMI